MPSTALDVARSYMNAVSSGDLGAALSCFHQDARWHQPGSHRFSGTYVGPEAIGGLIGAMMTATSGTFRLEALAPMRNGEWVVFPVRFTGDGPGDRLDMGGIDALRIEDGRIAEVRLFSEDQEREDSFWGRD